MRIEGASDEQRTVLQEILSGLPETRIEALRVRPLELTEGATGPVGLELALERPREPDLRATWETVLVAHAFRDLSRDAVVWVSTPLEGHSIEGKDQPGGAPDRDKLEEAVHVAAAQTGAMVERVEISSL